MGTEICSIVMKLFRMLQQQSWGSTCALTDIPLCNCCSCRCCGRTCTAGVRCSGGDVKARLTLCWLQFRDAERILLSRSICLGLLLPLASLHVPTLAASDYSRHVSESHELQPIGCFQPNRSLTVLTGWHLLPAFTPTSAKLLVWSPKYCLKTPYVDVYSLSYPYLHCTTVEAHMPCKRSPKPGNTQPTRS